MSCHDALQINSQKVQQRIMYGKGGERGKGELYGKEPLLPALYLAHYIVTEESEYRMILRVLSVYSSLTRWETI